jgi:hypothetical protein
MSRPRHSPRFDRPNNISWAGLRQVLSTTAWTLGSQVRILLEAWMCIRVFLCFGGGLALGWSPGQGVLPNVSICRSRSPWG